MIKHGLLAICLCLAAAAALAEGERIPATFDGDVIKNRLVNRIEFPDFSGDVEGMVLCWTDVKRNGKLEYTGCFARDRIENEFGAAVMKAAKRSTMRPATFDGKKRGVFIHFRVEFIRKDGENRVFIYNNPGHIENVEAYGYDHIAPQRTVGREPWHDACPKRADYRLLAKVFIAEDGQADKVSLEHMRGILPTQSCRDAIIATMESSEFTPTYADGVAVPSAYIQTFGNH